MAGRILITGGAGFIGSALCRHLIAEGERRSVVNLDKLTYAANLESLASIAGHPRYRFEKADICDAAALSRLFADFRPDAVLHLAAESHVDRSIDGPAAFIETNIVGTYRLLEAARDYWRGLERKPHARAFASSMSRPTRSTAAWARTAPSARRRAYQPNSPYSASKAAADHLARAWHHTYGLPVIVTNCSNNYGPYQFPGKADPADDRQRARRAKRLPVYGQRREPARLAACGRPCARPLPSRCRKGGPARNTISAAGPSGTISRSSATICAILDRLRPVGDSGRMTG